MATTYVAFDNRSGRILSLHRGAVDEKHAHERAKHHAKIDHAYMTVMSVPSDSVERGKQYKVDVGRKVLIVTPGGEDGVGFSFGAIG
jgi:hypothetical protein